MAEQYPPSESLVWMDLEMTGLDPERDTIIEIATLITNSQLEITAEGPELVIHQDPSWFKKMDSWNQEHHTKSGLWDAVVKSQVSIQQAEKLTFEFIRDHVSKNTAPLCGNSIWQDRRFLVRYMPSIDTFLHYRMIDVSTLKELARRWYPSLGPYSKKTSSHRALDDIRESIEELKYYKKAILIPGEVKS